MFKRIISRRFVHQAKSLAVATEHKAKSIFCLKVLICYPDDKMPSADMIVEHFESKAGAEKRLVALKKKYIAGFDEDFEEMNISVEVLDKYIKSGELRYIMYDGGIGMENDPFVSEVFEVKVCSDLESDKEECGARVSEPIRH